MPEGRLQRTRAVYTTPAQITADVDRGERRLTKGYCGCHSVTNGIGFTVQYTCPLCAPRATEIETDYWNVIEGEDHDLTQPTPFRRLR